MVARPLVLVACIGVTLAAAPALLGALAAGGVALVPPLGSLIPGGHVVVQAESHDAEAGFVFADCVNVLVSPQGEDREAAEFCVANQEAGTRVAAPLHRARSTVTLEYAGGTLERPVVVPWGSQVTLDLRFTKVWTEDDPSSEAHLVGLGSGDASAPWTNPMPPILGALVALTYLGLVCAIALELPRQWIAIAAVAGFVFALGVGNDASWAMPDGVEFLLLGALLLLQYLLRANGVATPPAPSTP